MTYYLGTSKNWYDLQSKLDIKFPRRKLRIHCLEDFLLARNFAHKSARQDGSIGVVIEITKEDDFTINKHYKNCPILTGKLTPQNHKLHLLEGY